jgi:hypothetical protein
MTDSVFTASCLVVLDDDGYRWERRLVHHPHHDEEETVLVEKPSPLRTRRYVPRDETGLFRTFADIDPSTDGILAFVRRYGRLGEGVEKLLAEIQSENVAPAGWQANVGEPLEDWQDKIRWIGFLIQFWDMTERHDKRGLARFIQWEGRDTVFFVPPDKFQVPDRLFSNRKYRRLVASRDGTPNPVDAIRPGDVVAPARLLLDGSLSGMMKGLVTPMLLWDYRRMKHVLENHPRSLYGAIAMQFAHAIEGGRQHRRCRECGRWFEVGSGTSKGAKRADRETCSNACRVRSYRQRQDLARRMHAHGKTVRAIAKELGSSVDTLRKWVTNTRG